MESGHFMLHFTTFHNFLYIREMPIKASNGVVTIFDFEKLYLMRLLFEQHRENRQGNAERTQDTPSFCDHIWSHVELFFQHKMMLVNLKVNYYHAPHFISVVF